MADQILNSWLENEYTQAMSFARQSDVLRLAPVAGVPPFRYIAEFRCNGLVRTADGIDVCDRHLVGINFPPSYLETSPDPGQVLTWLEPAGEWHPNIRAPFACVGHIVPGMSLTSLLLQLFEMISWRRFTPREDDALNPDACSWARNNLDRLPVDDRRSMLRQQPRADTGGAGNG